MKKNLSVSEKSEKLYSDLIGNEYLEIFGKVLVLHRKVHCALQPLIPGIDDLSWETIQRLLNIMLGHRVK